MSTETVAPTATEASVHSKLLDYLGKLVLPQERKLLELDWSADSALGQVKKAILDRHYACPCECLVGSDRHGMEIQHHDGGIGEIGGPVGMSFFNALANQGDAYNNMQALLAPNLPPPVRTMIITKVKTNSFPRVLQLWGAAQEGLARAVAEAWENGWFPKGYNRSHVIVTGIFVHPLAGLKTPPKAEEGEKQEGYNHKAFLEGADMEESMFAILNLVRLAGLGMIADAMTGGLTPEEIIIRSKTARHPYRGYTEAGTVVTA